METWFGKRAGKRMGSVEPLIPGCHVHLWNGAAAVLLSVTKDKSYKWNLEMDLIPSTLVHWICKEMGTNKEKVKC